MDNKKSSKETLRKLLYSDSDDKRKMFLNINLLRELKKHLLEHMKEKERGCINLYQIENYLIERALDPLTEEIYKDCEHLINDTLNYLRSRPDYWIINSEVYLDIISKNGKIYYSDDKYINKDLVAIYNFIYKNSFKKITSSSQTTAHEINDYLNDENYPIEKLVNDADYCKFLNLLERDSCLEIDESKKLLYDINILPLIFKFILSKYSEELNKNFSSDYDLNLFQVKIQNFILFFSYIEYNESLASLWIQKPENLPINPNAKKYRLRLSKINEEELDKIYLENQIKIFNLQEKINHFKNTKLVVEFFQFLKQNNTREIINSLEINQEKSENKMNLILYSYILLNNVFNLLKEYLKVNLDNGFNLKEKLLTPFINQDMKTLHKNFRKYFSSFKLLKNLYSEIINENDRKLKEIVEFYVYVIENKNSYEGSLYLMIKYMKFNKVRYNSNTDVCFNTYEKCFGTNLNLEKLDILANEYVNDYYEHETSKMKRIYKMENAGINWNERDLKNFEDGLVLYGHCQLANTKIAKFMGNHIEPSHVKWFRGRICKEKRIQKKIEKEMKIKEMRKRKNISWKAAPQEL